MESDKLIFLIVNKEIKKKIAQNFRKLREFIFERNSQTKQEIFKKVGVKLSMKLQEICKNREKCSQGFLFARQFQKR